MSTLNPALWRDFSFYLLSLRILQSPFSSKVFSIVGLVGDIRGVDSFIGSITQSANTIWTACVNQAMRWRRRTPDALDLKYAIEQGQVQAEK